MNKTLIALYDRFYIPPGMDQDKVEIEEAHQLLIERLDKPERKLVLKIIDGKDRIAENLSEDSFISGLGKVSLQRHNHKSQQKTEPTYTKTSLFQEKGGVFFVARFGKGVVLT